MSGPAAVHRIEDPFGFARAAGRQGGNIAIATMRRLEDRLTGTDGSVVFTVKGACDPQQRPMVELEVSGTLQMRCDRCLAPMDYRLALQSRVLLARPGAVPQDDEDPETPEWIEAGQELDLAGLVEDEILLGLPLSVRHDQDACGSGKGSAKRDDGKQSPFLQLSSLVGSRQTDKR